MRRGWSCCALPACPSHLFCCPNLSSSSWRLQGLLVPELLTHPAGAAWAGVCQLGVPRSFQSGHGCADPGMRWDTQLLTPELLPLAPSLRPCSAAQWGGDGLPCPLLSPLNREHAEPKAPLVWGCDCHGAGGDPTWFPQRPRTGLCPLFLRCIDPVAQGQWDGTRPTPKEQ